MKARKAGGMTSQAPEEAHSAVQHLKGLVEIHLSGLGFSRSQFCTLSRQSLQRLWQLPTQKKNREEKVTGCVLLLNELDERRF
jgi:hypothetical protein